MVKNLFFVAIAITAAVFPVSTVSADSAPAAGGLTGLIDGATSGVTNGKAAGGVSSLVNGVGQGGFPGASGPLPGGLPGVGGVDKGARPNIGGALPNIGGALPNIGGALPNTGGALPNIGGMQPSTGGALPTIGGALPGVSLLPGAIGSGGKASPPSQASDPKAIGGVSPNDKASADPNAAPFAGSPSSIGFQDAAPAQQRRLRAN